MDSGIWIPEYIQSIYIYTICITNGHSYGYKRNMFRSYTTAFVVNPVPVVVRVIQAEAFVPEEVATLTGNRW